MAFIEKVVPITVANTDTLIYEMPAAQNGSAHGITGITAGTSTNITLKLFQSATGLTTAITGGKAITANNEWTYPKPVNLAAGDRLYASATTANTATIVAAIYNDQTQTLVQAFNPRGAWTSAASYVLGDVVDYNGSSYIALRANVNDPPPSTNWMVQALAVAGPQGVQGVKGDKGDQGIQGPIGNTGAAGGEAVFFDHGTVASGTVTMDYPTAQHRRVQAGGAITLAVTNWPPAGRTGELMVELVNGGSYTITFPGGVNWILGDGSTSTSFASYGVPLSVAGTDFILFWTRDGGTTIYGMVVR